MVTYLGLLAAVVTSAGPLLQMVKTLRTRDTSGLSWGMWISLCVGIVLWLCYGIIKEDIPLIVANSVTLCSSAVILGVMVRNRRARVGQRMSLGCN
ncbi:MAG: SemiSWEET transporter [Patescibacteria group bacterium]